MKKKLAALILAALLLSGTVMPVMADDATPTDASPTTDTELSTETSFPTETVLPGEMLSATETVFSVDSGSEALSHSSTIDGTKRTVIAINTTLDAETDSTGSFTASEQITDEVYGGMSFTDPVTGETYYAVDRSPAVPEKVSASRADTLSEGSLDSIAAASYQVGDTKTIYSASDSHLLLISTVMVSVKMKCLYVGTHCTVWGQTASKYFDSYYNSGLLMNETQAAQIGQEFDSKFEAITEAFGDYWYDADKDGKLAIYCYDIDRDYTSLVSSNTYTAGYFYCCDLAGSSGKGLSKQYNVNGVGISYGTGNEADCIHIDTYPGMGSSEKLSHVEYCYSTLMHEFQHMINYSYTVKNGSAGSFDDMETYLNEAFSMAAEHMICGWEKTASRVNYFNSTSYTPGTSLTCWGSDLSNYSNSYLFGQYLRVRWSQTEDCTDPSGNDFFREVFSRRNRSNAGDTLAIIAEMLGTSQEQLVMDFWTAVWKKDSSGRYGFNGEDWADAICPQSDTANTGEIHNGGARFYSFSGAEEPDSATLQFVTVTEGGVVFRGVAPAFGDCDGDGEATVLDMACLFDYLSTGVPDGALAPDKALFCTVADLNGDRAINILDYQCLYEIVKAAD